MQKLSIPLESVSFTTMYQSDRFAVVKASIVIGNHKDFPIEAEGISRRSDLDNSNPVLGQEIARGRALKALSQKLRHLPIRHPYMG